MALTPRVHRARESLPRGPPSPQRPAEIPEQVVQAAADPRQPRGRPRQGSVVLHRPRGNHQGFPLQPRMKLGWQWEPPPQWQKPADMVRVVMSYTWSTSSTCWFPPPTADLVADMVRVARFPPFEFPVLGHGPLLVVEFHHIFFFFSPFRPKGEFLMLT